MGVNPLFLNTRQVTKRLIRDSADGKIVIGPPFSYNDTTRPMFVVAGSGRSGFWQGCIVLADSESYAQIATGLERKRTVYRVTESGRTDGVVPPPLAVHRNVETAGKTH
jgi:hypothetical protein